MKNTAIVCPSYFGVEGNKTWELLSGAAAHRLAVIGCSNITQARNVLLTAALSAPEQVDTFLLWDDDIVATVKDATDLIGIARRTGRLTAACYALDELTPAAKLREGGGWLTGLGFAALPRKLLHERAKSLSVFLARQGDAFMPFCQTGVHPCGRWMTEDMWLCEELGGAVLAHIGVVHDKPSGPLHPPEDLQRWFRGCPDTYTPNERTTKNESASTKPIGRAARRH